jgi:hypothetical protein
VQPIKSFVALLSDGDFIRFRLARVGQVIGFAGSGKV